MKKSTALQTILKSAFAAQALFIISASSPSVTGRMPANDDATVDITTDQTIRIGANIIIYGDGATLAKAKDIQNNILKNWATDSDGRPWTYFDPESGQRFKVEISAAVKLYQGKEKQKPEYIPDSYNPLSRNNYIEITTEPQFRSFVHAGDEGKWAAVPYYVDTYAHEFGHILGFDDRYFDVGRTSYTEMGWESNLMSCEYGSRVEQRNIDAIVGKIMSQYRVTDLFRNKLQIPRDTSDGYIYRGALNISRPNL